MPEHQQQNNATQTEASPTEAPVEATDGQTPEASEAQVNADNNADDYEALVSRYDAAIQASETPAEPQTASPPAAEPAPQAPAPAAPPPHDPRTDVLYEHMQRDLQRSNNEDFDAVVTLVKDDSPAFQALPDKYVRGILEKEAREDPRFLRAFQNRQIDPNAWKELALAKGKELAKELKALPDEAATNGLNAVRASVSSQNNGAQISSSTDDINNMSDEAFTRMMETEFG